MNYHVQPEELWRQQKIKLKLLLPQLSDDDFKYDYGMKEVMLTKLQTKLGKSREELNALLSGL
jgi:hypothetical protein